MILHLTIGLYLLQSFLYLVWHMASSLLSRWMSMIPNRAA